MSDELLQEYEAATMRSRTASTISDQTPEENAEEEEEQSMVAGYPRSPLGRLSRTMISLSTSQLRPLRRRCN